jgi:hypothetical protein
MPSKDPEIRRQSARCWYLRHKAGQIARVKQLYPHYVMDFDHVRTYLRRKQKKSEAGSESNAA